MNDAKQSPLEKLLRNPPKPRVPQTLLPTLQADLQSHCESARPRSGERVATIPATLIVSLRRLIRPVRWNFAGLALCWSMILVLRWTTPHSGGTTETARPLAVTKQMWIIMAAERRALLATSEPAPSEPDAPPASPGVRKETRSTNSPGA